MAIINEQPSVPVDDSHLPDGAIFPGSQTPGISLRRRKPPPTPLNIVSPAIRQVSPAFDDLPATAVVSTPKVGTPNLGGFFTPSVTPTTTVQRPTTPTTTARTTTTLPTVTTTVVPSTPTQTQWSIITAERTKTVFAAPISTAAAVTSLLAITAAPTSTITPTAKQQSTSVISGAGIPVLAALSSLAGIAALAVAAMVILRRRKMARLSSENEKAYNPA